MLVKTSKTMAQQWADSITGLANGPDVTHPYYDMYVSEHRLKLEVLRASLKEEGVTHTDVQRITGEMYHTIVECDECGGGDDEAVVLASGRQYCEYCIDRATEHFRDCRA